MKNALVRKYCKYFDNVISQINLEEKRFVIYTNGVVGKFAKEYLKQEYKIDVAFVIDNKAYNGQDVLNLEQAKKRNESDIVYLICSDNLDFYNEVRKAIYDALPKEQIVDVFSTINKKDLPTEEQIVEVLTEIDKHLENMEKQICG